MSDCTLNSFWSMKSLWQVPRLDILSWAYRNIKIFAIASPHADLPAEVLEKVSGSEFAMVSKWCPQQMILSHPVRLHIPCSRNYI